VITGAVTLLLVGPMARVAGRRHPERTAGSRSTRRPTSCRSGSASGTTRSSSGYFCRWRSSVPGSRCCSFGSRTDQGRKARRAAGRHDPSEGGLLLIAWWVVPWVLAVLYQPSWPLEDALRPQRLWLIASQPGLILGAIGLVDWSRPSSRPAVEDPACSTAGNRLRSGRVGAGHGGHDAPSRIDLDGAHLRPPSTSGLTASRTSRSAPLPLAPSDRPDIRGLVVSGPGTRQGSAWSPSSLPDMQARLSTPRRSPVTGRSTDGPTWRPRSAATRRSWSRPPKATAPIASSWHGAARGPDSSANRRLCRCRGRSDRHVPGRRGQRLGCRRPRPGRDADDPHATSGPIDLEIRLLTPAADPDAAPTGSDSTPATRPRT
jgi:hypothetical protein